MFLLSAQNNFYIILSSRVCAKKYSSLNFMSSVGFHVIKIWVFFWKNFCGAILVNANNIRCIILEIKNDRCKIAKILFCSLSQEHFKNVLGKENEISVLTILHLLFLIFNMMLLILLFAIKLLARLSIFKYLGNHFQAEIVS